VEDEPAAKSAARFPALIALQQYVQQSCLDDWDRFVGAVVGKKGIRQ
jgi:hypothetical protein